VWVGNDEYGEKMRRVYGGHLPAEIFNTMMTKVYSCQYETIGEGEDAEKVLVYEPPFQQTTFVKPPGATFNGFPAPQTGTKLVKDEEGNLVPEDELEENEDEDQEGEARDDAAPDDGISDDLDSGHGFYQPFEPPPSN
jgi:membrane peptidoglycan carboxypeptidase